MYNTHRGLMQPPHAPPASRITDLLEQIRMEFENQANQLSQAGQSREYDQQREHMIRQQVQEMEMMRDRVHQLETTHAQRQQDWEKQVDTLKRELEMRGGHAQQPRHPAPHQPPSIGHGPRDLFGQIMAGGGTQSSALAPPQQAPEQATGLPVHLNQGAGLNTGPQHPQHQPYPGTYPGGGPNGYAGQQPPPLNPSPGPGKPARRPPPGGGSTPQQNAPMPYPPSPRGHGPTPPPARHAQPPPPAPAQALQNVGNELGALKVEELPPDLKKQGDDWWAVFNPQISRQLDVSLVHTLVHSSVVCCVRFSLDGNYVATGCNRVAQIFDVHSGKSVATLEDETGDKEGDLYIRSVCFSPDGTYLATGAEDKCIRVWDIGAGRIVHTFVGHEQDIYSLDFSRNGQLIASGSGDRTVKLWDLKAKEERVTLVIEEGVTTVALSPDGRLVAAGSLDRSVRVWDTETGMRIESLEGPPSAGHTDSVYSVAFSPTGRELVSGSLDKTIKMWELSSPGPRDARGPQSKGIGRCIRTFEGHSDFVLSVALTPDGDWVLSGSKDRGVVFWDPHSGIPQLHLQGHKNSVISVAPSPKPGLFATGSGDSRARIWRYEPYRGP